MTFLCLITSCATIFNGPVQKVTIQCDPEVTVKDVTCDSEKVSLTGQSDIYPYRSPSPLVLSASVNGKDTMFPIYAHRSFAYWLNIYFNYGPGMLIEHKNPKTYGYPKTLCLEYEDSVLTVNA